jgi:hypothetical protein
MLGLPLFPSLWQEGMGPVLPHAAPIAWRLPSAKDTTIYPLSSKNIVENIVNISLDIYLVL